MRNTLNILLALAALLAGAAAQTDTGFNWDGTPDPRPLADRCHEPRRLDNARDVEVHLRCVLATLGNPVVLPNPFNPDDADNELFGQYCNAVDEALAHVQGLLERCDDGAAGGVRAAVADLDELLRSSADAVRAMKQYLEGLVDDPDADCRDIFTADPDGQGDGANDEAVRATCRQLRDVTPDPRARPDDPNYENAAGAAGLTVKLGSHLVPFPRWGSFHVPHERMTSGQVPAGGAFTILKEFFGIKLSFHVRWVPVWQEPWTSRAKIVGYRRRVYLRWTVCEYLKSIIYQDRGRARGYGHPKLRRPIVPRVVSTNYCDNSLLSFWRFF